MSKKIDFSKPLTDEELEYAEARPWLLKDAELNGFDVASEEDFRLAAEDENEDPEGFENPEDPESEEVDEEEDEEVVPYSEWEFPALKAEAEARGLPKSGSKEQLIKRLEDDDSEKSDEEDETE